mmetsp:Transcript_35234/g.97461  ORF Transcript_35234/g.97461 Transcript_35234/m.97461 type:complete len:268 (-) Transcript_35234:3815-4618(-)
MRCPQRMLPPRREILGGSGSRNQSSGDFCNKINVRLDGRAERRALPARRCCCRRRRQVFIFKKEIVKRRNVVHRLEDAGTAGAVAERGDEPLPLTPCPVLLVLRGRAIEDTCSEYFDQAVDCRTVDCLHGLVVLVLGGILHDACDAIQRLACDACKRAARHSEGRWHLLQLLFHALQELFVGRREQALEVVQNAHLLLGPLQDRGDHMAESHGHEDASKIDVAVALGNIVHPDDDEEKEEQHVVDAPSQLAGHELRSRHRGQRVAPA